MFTPPLQMGSGGMMPGSIDWGSMWFFMVLPSVAVLAVIAVIVYLYLGRERTRSLSGPPSSPPPASVTPLGQQSSDRQAQAGNVIMGDVFRTLAPTLMDDEKRVMDELTRAGGEVLQSDLPRMTSFSKATVSKVIHSLEVRGIVVREKHKWTYWCKINPRLVDRVRLGEMVPPSGMTPDQAAVGP